MKSNLVNLQTSLLLSTHQSHSSCDRSIISCCVVLWLYLKITTNKDVILIASTQQRLANINQFLNLQFTSPGLGLALSTFLLWLKLVELYHLLLFF